MLVWSAAGDMSIVVHALPCNSLPRFPALPCLACLLCTAPPHPACPACLLCPATPYPASLPCLPCPATPYPASLPCLPALHHPNLPCLPALQNEITKKCPPPCTTTDTIFYAGTGMLLCRSEDKVRQQQCTGHCSASSNAQACYTVVCCGCCLFKFVPLQKQNKSTQTARPLRPLSFSLPHPPPLFPLPLPLLFITPSLPPPRRLPCLMCSSAAP